MKIFRSLIGGLAGASVLTLMHQFLKNNLDDAPRMDLLGEEALDRGLDVIGVAPLEHEKAQKVTLAGDLILNTLFFSAAATTISSCSKGTLLGIAAGLGGIYLPEKMGLNPEHSNKNLNTKIMTVGLYALGGYVAGKVIDRL